MIIIVGLRNKLSHLTYDGVYADSSERKRGGGLDLVGNICKYLEISPDNITGQHDLGHNIQLIFGDGIEKDKKVNQMLDHVYNFMEKHQYGKARSLFDEFCEENDFPALTNKGGRQKTRWVRADERNMYIFARNVPVFYYINGKLFAEANTRCANDDAKIYKENLDTLSDGKTLAYIIGYLQILQRFSETSVYGQSSRKFATTIFEGILELDEDVQNLAESWRWRTTPLQFTSMGPPKTIIDNMVSNGFYNPLISNGARREFLKKKNLKKKGEKELLKAYQEAGLSQQTIDKFTQKKKSFLEEANSVLETDTSDKEEDLNSESDDGEKQSFHQNDLSEIPIQNFGPEELREVEQDLSTLAGKLHDIMNNRMKFNEDTAASHAAFHNVEFLYTEENWEDTARERMRGIFKHLSHYNQERFVEEDCLLGYIFFLKIVKQVYDPTRGEATSIENVYGAFHDHVKCKDDDDMAGAFMDLFEFLQLKGFSEAIWYTFILLSSFYF